MARADSASYDSDQIFEFEGFRVEVGERRLLREGEILTLPPKVFGTLVVLLESAGRLVSKEQLMSRVWAGRLVEEAAVAKAVFVLRKALDDSREAPRLIATVSKAGYRFIAPVKSTRPSGHGSSAVPAPLPFRRRSDALADHDAYETYLRARYMLARRTAASVERAIDVLHNLTVRSPHFAPALVALAGGYIVRSIYSRTPDVDTLRQADQTLDQALALSCPLSEAYAARGYASLFRWNFEAAERDLLRSIELDPRNLSARQWYAEYLRMMGRQAEALEQSTAALRIDPLSLIVNVEAALPHYYLGDYERAEKQLLKTIDLDPTFASAHGHLAVVYDGQGRHREALAAIMEARRLDDSPWIEAELGIIDAHLGRIAEAVSILSDLSADPAARGSVSASLAELRLALGDVDGALAALEEGTMLRSSQLVNIGVDPRLAPLRGTRRFTDALTRIGLLDLAARFEQDPLSPVLRRRPDWNGRGSRLT